MDEVRHESLSLALQFVRDSKPVDYPKCGDVVKIAQCFEAYLKEGIMNES